MREEAVENMAAGLEELTETFTRDRKSTLRTHIQVTTPATDNAG